MTAQPKSRSRRKPGVTDFARQLRAGENMAEALMWNQLKSRQLGGYKFVRQFPVGPYFADFVCRSKKLVVEIDGSQHAGSEKDNTRDHFMNSSGFTVVRFWSIDVLKNMSSVCETILALLDDRMIENITSSNLRVTKPSSSMEPVESPPLRQLR
jgi:very-short-patch-repair endonuclease